MQFRIGQKIIDILRGKTLLKSKIKVSGKNNKVFIKNPKNPKLKLYIDGNNNNVQINTDNYFDSTIYVTCSDCEIYVGENTSANGMTVKIMENGTKFSVGKDVMISEDVVVYCTDTHAILDNEGNLLNKGEFVEIGDHSWICKDVRILKNTKIPKNSVVGLGSVVSKVFDKENVVIAGNPAKIVKENINWIRKTPQTYLDELNK